MKTEWSIPAWFDERVGDPETRSALERRADGYHRSDGRRYAIRDGIPSLVFPETLGGQDGDWNRFYDAFAPFYNLMQVVLSPFMLGETAASAHRKVTAQIPVAPGSCLLEVSPGPGTFHRFLRERLGAEGRLVSLDLSFQMLQQCRRRGDRAAVLVHGNGQHLPFRDGAFDALFHFGGVNLFNDPNRALAEFVRVVRPGGIVSWGDEGFAPDYPDGRMKRMLTRMNPGYLKPRPPVPEGLCDVVTEAVYGGTGYLVVGRKR